MRLSHANEKNREKAILRSVCNVARSVFHESWMLFQAIATGIDYQFIDA